MNRAYFQAAEQALKQNIIFYPLRLNWRNIFWRFFIIICGLGLITAIILLKSKTTEQFNVGPLVFSYAVFVSAFIFSRLVAAMFYERSLANLNYPENDFNSLECQQWEPKVAFVIPGKNEGKDIADSIINCYQLDYPKEKIEVIAVNDGSTDNTLDVLKDLKKTYPSLRVIDWPENQGKRWGMAAGFKISKAEIIVQLDSDSCVDPKTFRELIAPFRNPEIGAVCAHGVPKNADKNFITKMQTAYYFMSFRILKAAESSYDSVFCLSGCCSAYRKKAVMPIIYKWLTESFLGRPVTWGDDRALTSWLLKENWKTVYSKDAIAYTVVPDSFRTLLKQQLRWKKSWIINSIFTSRFIWKKQPFVAFFYYFPLVAISFLTPFMTFRALYYLPIVHRALPFFHVVGIMLITGLIVIFYRYVDKNNKYWPYLFFWSVLSLFVFSFMIVWAAIKIQDRGWGTR